MKKTAQSAYQHSKTVLGHICLTLALVAVMSLGSLSIGPSQTFAEQTGLGSQNTGGQTDLGSPGTGGQTGLGSANRPSSQNLRFANPIKATSLAALLNDLLRIVTILGSIVVVFFFILAGFNYVTARGDSAKISAATQTFTWTAVGAAVILGAQVIARVIQGTITQLGS